MLLDEADIIIEGGHGGPGKVSFYPGHYSGPDGGNGGKGGDVYIKVTSDLTALNQFSRKKEISAENGLPGSSNRKFGSDGKDLEVILPIGTSIIDKKTGKEIELNDLNLRILICKGGKGGKGNFELKSSRRTTPEFAQPGLPGEKKELKLNLKLIADYGLIGLPNAGKSSLLNELTAASAKVANYPFTTLEPNLGVFNRKILADIPGLIEGASSGKGLGIRFLKHIEKVKVLLHCISVESSDPFLDYNTIKKELSEYNPQMLKKKEVILLTKSDLVTKEEINKIKTQLKPIKKTVLVVSIHDWESLEKLKKIIK